MKERISDKLIDGLGSQPIHLSNNSISLIRRYTGLPKTLAYRFAGTITTTTHGMTYSLSRPVSGVADS